MQLISCENSDKKYDLKNAIEMEWKEKYLYKYPALQRVF